jgi:hypothetical protein
MKLDSIKAAVEFATETDTLSFEMVSGTTFQVIKDGVVYPEDHPAGDLLILNTQDGPVYVDTDKIQSVRVVERHKGSARASRSML